LNCELEEEAGDLVAALAAGDKRAAPSVNFHSASNIDAETVAQ
jgi:hypothetical protein